MTLHIFCIVEGHGEERGYPNLLRNYLARQGRYEVNIFKPYRLPRGQFSKGEFISEIVRFGRRRIADELCEGDSGLILVSCDSDGECPVALRFAIEEAINDEVEQLNLSVVICHREFEAWFLAGAQSFIGHADCRDQIPHFENPEAIQDAKGVFERQVLKEGRYYSETVDQQKFAALLNFDMSSRAKSRSLRRLVKVLDEA